ncbi:MAG: glycosyltransferase family 2 protein [Bacilli bacterium]|nr:glycosyltransferase family 2 protein [Bacilli bacterium]
MNVKKDNYSRIAILIPTYNPTEKLKKVVNLLRKEHFNNIIVVNDGSVNDRILYDIKVSKILGYGFNRGKGYALKTGFEYIQRLDVDGVITLDDDLQHDILDVKKIADLFLENSSVYFGIRIFDKAPIVRREANRLTSKMFKKIYNYDISDTQTGLRCFPKSILPKLIQIKGDKFDYELNQLKYLVLNNYDIKKVIIKTIYNDNKSHYSGIVDSYRIMKVLLNKNNYI